MARRVGQEHPVTSIHPVQFQFGHASPCGDLCAPSPMSGQRRRLAVRGCLAGFAGRITSRVGKKALRLPEIHRAYCMRLHAAVGECAWGFRGGEDIRSSGLQRRHERLRAKSGACNRSIRAACRAARVPSRVLRQIPAADCPGRGAADAGIRACPRCRATGAGMNCRQRTDQRRSPACQVGADHGGAHCDSGGGCRDGRAGAARDPRRGHGRPSPPVVPGDYGRGRCRRRRFPDGVQCGTLRRTVGDHGRRAFR